MKNKQGFLPNRLNKYSIRKFTVGTASLLIGATLVFGVSSEVKADELDSITNDNKANDSDKGEALDVQDIKSVEDNNTTSSRSENSVTEEKTENSNNELQTEETDNDLNPDQKELDNNGAALGNTEEYNNTNESTNEVLNKQPTEASDISETKQDVNNDTSSSAEDSTNKDNTDQKTTTKSNEQTNDKNKAEDTTDETSTETSTETTKDTDISSNETPTEKALEKNPDTSNKTKEDTRTENLDGQNDNQPLSEPSSEEERTTKVTRNPETNNHIQSKLTKQLSETENKQKAVEDYLNSQLSTEDTKAILENADIDYKNTTDEEINIEILKASIIQLSNEQDKTKTLATPKRTLLRSMATPTALRAAVEQNEKVEKSLGYMDNYTFASLIFDPGKLDSQKTLDSNIIPFDIHSYMSGSNSGDRYKIDLKLDPKIASHVTKISANPSGRNTPVEFIRLKDEDGNFTNTWEINFIRANDGLFGGAEILSQYTAANGKIELDDTIGNILNASGDLSNNKLNYQMFIRDSLSNKIVKTSESSGYFLTTSDKDLSQLENNLSPENSNAFKASSGSATYDGSVGTHGGLLIDQQIMKNGIFSYSKIKSKQWSYNYQIDKDLLPYIEGVELHTYDYKGLSGFDKTYHAEDKVADLQLDSIGNGTITSNDLNKLIEFNNTLPETVGVRIVIKLNQSVNNILTKDAEYDSEGNLIRETTKQKEDFTFAGYLTDSNNLLINNTLGTSTLALQDYDKDGLLDRYERQVSLSDPENEDTDGDGKNDGDEVINYKTSPLVGKPDAADITNEDRVVTGSVPLKEGAATQTAKVLDATGKVIGTSIVNPDGTFSVSIPQSPEGTYTIAIDSPNYENDEVNTFEVIDISKVPTPSINPVDDNDTVIKVNGSAGAIVTVKDNNNVEIGKVQIPNDGSAASLTLNQPLKAGTILTATASKGGKTSEVSDQITVTDATAPDAPVINPITSKATQVTGTAEPNSTVTVAFSGGGKVSVTTDSQGRYTVDIPSGVTLQGGEVFKAIATDKAGNESSVATRIVTDVTAPDAPTLNDVNSNSKQLNGQAEANSTVSVTFPSGEVVDTVADQDGNFTVDIPENEGLQGGETIVATSKDKAGNISQKGSTQVIDATAPDAPQISHVTSVSTEVKGTAEANSTVSVTFPSGEVVETKADQDGNFTVSIPENEELQGKETISATSKDSAGNVSHAGSTTVTDATAPAPPTVNSVTSQDTNISGTAEPGSTVTITFPNGEVATGETDETGKYIIAIPNEVDLEGGEELQVISTDDTGNETEPVKTTVKDTTAPDAPTINDVTSEDTQIIGKAEPGSTVTVTFPDNTTAIGTADDQGNYTIDITSGTKLEGSEELQVTATDKTGNISKPTSTTVIDKTAPDAPKVNRVSSEDVQIAGSSEPNSTVTITFPGNITVDVEADEHGNFIVDIPNTVDLIGGEEIQAIAQDKSNNKSIEASTIVVDATAPNAPTVKDVTSEDTTIGGTAEPGSTVTVTFPDGTTAESKANDQGEYTITIPEKIDLKGDEELLISAMDSNGNISDSLTTTVKDTTAPEAPTVKDVTSEDTTIGGTAEPGSTVTVTFPDGTTATGTADD
ncbi:Ig-like domain-containing protein, partial [Staphylococcus sp. GDX8P113P-2]